MRIIIAGSRTITKKNIVFAAFFYGLAYFLDVLIERKESLKLSQIEIVSGGAKGVDTIARDVAKLVNTRLILFLADWNKYGKKAGYLRNEKMAKYADALIAVWDGKSKGTKMMIDIARKEKLLLYIYRHDDNN